jgi:glycosyltransferase involved in cell wall biosynthesis
MEILFIASLPPPINGQAYVTDVLLVAMQTKHRVTVINTAKELSDSRYFLLSRSLKTFNLLFKVWKNRRKVDAIYITISESLLGNIRDIFTYLCFASTLSNVIIHLHGGSIKKELWDKNVLLYKVNRIILKKIGGVIISGESHREIFAKIIPQKKLHLFPNFAPKHMFISDHELNLQKDTTPLRILYLSSLREKKGYQDLLEAIFNIPENVRKRLQVDFAGAFRFGEKRDKFLSRVATCDQIRYHGIVSEKQKKKLFAEAHIFCFPSKYFEGQPISILEAYASGCVVLTTCPGGIRDIFINNINGYEIQADDPKSISDKIEYCLANPDKIESLSSFNRKVAKTKYKEDFFTTSIIKTIEKMILF